MQFLMNDSNGSQVADLGKRCESIVCSPGMTIINAIQVAMACFERKNSSNDKIGKSISQTKPYKFAQTGLRFLAKHSVHRKKETQLRWLKVIFFHFQFKLTKS